MKKTTALSDLQKLVAKFRDERGWRKYHNPKNLVISILVEAAELAEHFQWETPEEIETRDRDREKKEKVAAELADVVIYCLSFADRMKIDMSCAILKKLKHSSKKYPKEKAYDLQFIKRQKELYRRLGK